jgi:hypothetical protein
MNLWKLWIATTLLCAMVRPGVGHASMVGMSDGDVVQIAVEQCR